MTPAKLPDTTALSAEDLAEQITLGHRLATDAANQARDLAEKAAHYAVVTGLLLQTLRSRTPHGKWESLFASESKSVTCDRFEKPHNAAFGFSVATAKRYIRAAEGALSRPGLPAASRDRLMALGAGSTSRVTEIDPTLTADLERATRGETLRQLYLDLGIIRGSVAERGGFGGDTTGGRSARNLPPDTRTPEKILDDLTWETLTAGLVPTSQLINRGELGHLSGDRLRQLDDTFRSWLDALRPLIKSAG